MNEDSEGEYGDDSDDSRYSSLFIKAGCRPLLLMLKADYKVSMQMIRQNRVHYLIMKKALYRSLIIIKTRHVTIDTDRKARHVTIDKI